jgi:sugar/nucleoside kinase (ribokinase family)
MAALIVDDGLELRGLLERARALGVVTSLDLANASQDLIGSDVDWRRLLSGVLPQVDVFIPSLDEACHLLGHRVARDASGVPDLAAVGRLAERMIDLGVAVAGLKLGEHGLLIRTASAPRVGRLGLGLGPSWAGREMVSSVFETDVVGTAGAGDATIAGFLFGLLTGMEPERAVTAACAVGAASTEAPDGTGGVLGWPSVAQRLEQGWTRRPASPGPGWVSTPDHGLWLGPHDSAGAH